MERKIDQLIAAMRGGDYRAALRVAARFPRLGEHRDAIVRGWQALQTPEFYREIGRDPEALVASGVAALQERYSTYL